MGCLAASLLPVLFSCLLPAELQGAGQLLQASAWPWLVAIK